LSQLPYDGGKPAVADVRLAGPARNEAAPERGLGRMHEARESFRIGPHQGFDAVPDHERQILVADVLASRKQACGDVPAPGGLEALQGGREVESDDRRGIGGGEGGELFQGVGPDRDPRPAAGWPSRGGR
jgi:hypothetical protein